MSDRISSMIRRMVLLECAIAALTPAECLPAKVYTTADGLAHNSVHRILRDSRGLLWFCTAEGLSRFDGYSFTSYGTAEGLPNPSVQDILETRSGIYWVATEGAYADLLLSSQNQTSQFSELSISLAKLDSGSTHWPKATMARFGWEPGRGFADLPYLLARIFNLFVWKSREFRTGA